MRQFGIFRGEAESAWGIDMRNLSLTLSEDDEAYLVLSLDVELAWGLINADKNLLAFLIRNRHRTRTPVDFLLSSFERYNIPCTWAVVGQLFLRHSRSNDYTSHKDSSHSLENLGLLDQPADLADDPLFYGRDIVERIMSSSVDHEIGYHSFSHVVIPRCPEHIARAEIGYSCELSRELGIEFRSFVFPHNEVGHTTLLKEFGFHIYRGEAISRCKEGQEVFTKAVNALADIVLVSPSTPVYEDGIWKIPTCLHFWHAKLPLLPLWQARIGIHRTVKEKKVFTVFLHPWEFLLCPTLMRSFQKFLSFASDLRDKGSLSIVTMGELSKILDRNLRNLGPV